ncbi:hypothetical protein X962_4740 [Burkholderia pseudomallei MSHR7343]|nr:hypothetical protein X962_4740 [Burkholderia pseudomallei MSHR7343]
MAGLSFIERARQRAVFVYRQFELSYAPPAVEP